MLKSSLAYHAGSTFTTTTAIGGSHLSHDAFSAFRAAEDRKVGIAIGSIGVLVALFMFSCIYGLTMYGTAFYAGR